MKSFGMSKPTPPEGIEAEVLVVKDWEELVQRQSEVPGKIVVFAFPWEGYAIGVKYAP